MDVNLARGINHERTPTLDVCESWARQETRAKEKAQETFLAI